MTTRKLQGFIVYCSPGGTTRHVARIIEDSLETLGVPLSVCDLGEGEDVSQIIADIESAGADACLFIGSPVYVNHAVPPVTDFIDRLPENTGASAVPFVTWGNVSSGIALHEMGQSLHAKGFHIMGAAKVVAAHSMLWRAPDPLGDGHPDLNDDAIIRDLVRSVYEKLQKRTGKEVPLSALDYQPGELRQEMEKTTLQMAKGHMPKRKVNQAECIQCDVCKDICPVDAITLDPYPEFADSCIACFSCVRECPEEAIKTDLTQLEAHLRTRAGQLNEQPLTQVFL